LCGASEVRVTEHPERTRKPNRNFSRICGLAQGLAADPGRFRTAIYKRLRNGGIRDKEGGRRGRQSATTDAGGILRKIDFFYTRNDSGAGKIDLVWNV
jgi:hypothetical protein